MRSLTENEMEATYGGQTWIASFWNWLKNHIFVRTTGDPNRRIEGGVNLNM